MVKNLFKILGLVGILVSIPENSLEENFILDSEKKGYNKFREMKFDKDKVKLYEGSENYKMVFPGYEIYGNPGGAIDSMYLEGKKVENLRGISLKYAEEIFDSKFMDFYNKKKNR